MLFQPAQATQLLGNIAFHKPGRHTLPRTDSLKRVAIKPEGSHATNAIYTLLCCFLCLAMAHARYAHADESAKVPPSLEQSLLGFIFSLVS